MPGQSQPIQSNILRAQAFFLRAIMVLAVVVAAFGLARVLVAAPLADVAMLLGAGGLALSLGLWLLRQLALAQLRGLIADDPDPVVITDDGGQILGQSAPMIPLAEAQAGQPILRLFARRLAEPEAVFLRLTARLARDGGTVQERLSLGDRHGIILLMRAGPWLVWRLRPDSQPLTPQDEIETLPVALMRFQPNGKLVAANRAARALTGLAPDARPEAHELFEDLGRPVADWLADVAHGRHPGGAEMLRLHGGDQDAFFQATLAPVNAAQAGSDVMIVLSDASALKRLEAQFNQSQKMQAVGQLAGGIAHDFNNLLTAISGHCDLLMLRHRAEDSTWPDLVQIRQNANRAAALVGQLLAFSRKQTLKPERINLVEVLGDLGHLLNRLVGERIRLEVEHGRAIGPIRVDKRQLEQVIMNLVVNARDAMPEGGTVRLNTRSETLTDPFGKGAAAVPPGRYSVIHVIDSGIGIPPDRIGKIFDPFFTTKRAGEGTGLGLAMVYGIVKQSGGFIFVDSTVGEGTHFQLWFPVHDGPEPETAPTAPPKRAARGGTAVVLLVEDEAPVRAFASRALRLRGHTVLEAASGEEALAILDDDTLQVDIFVSDVVMPGLDGPTWVRHALEKRPQVRVVFTSGYAEESVAESHLRIPGAMFLPKPFSLTDLTEAVAKLVSV